MGSAGWKRARRWRPVVGLTVALVCAASGMAYASTPTAPVLTDVWVSNVNKVSVSWDASTDSAGHTLGYQVFRMNRPITAANLLSATSMGTTTGLSMELDADAGEVAEAYVWYYAVRSYETTTPAAVSGISKTMAPNLHGNREATNTTTCTRCHSVHGVYPDGWDYTYLQACYHCHASTSPTSPETDIGDKSTYNIKADFKEYPGQVRGSWHRSDAMADPAVREECRACHSPHRTSYYRDPTTGAYVAASSNRKMLRVQTGVDALGKPTYAYYSVNSEDLDGGQFCLACHGPNATPIGYVGDVGEYDASAGDHAYPVGGAAHDPNTIKSNDFGKAGTYLSAEYPQVQCLACHDKHASAADKLIAYRGDDTLGAGTYAQAELCYGCHKAGSEEANQTIDRTPTSNAPYAWNGRDVNAQFAKASAGGSSHPSTINTATTPASVGHDSWSDTTQAEFQAYGNAGALGDPGLYQTSYSLIVDAISLAQVTEPVDPPAEPWIFANRGASTTFDGYDLTSGTWDDGYNPDSHDGANGNSNFQPASGSSSYWVEANQRFYTTLGGTNTQYVFNPAGDATGTWSAGQTLSTGNIGTGGDTTVNSGTGHSWVYYTQAGGSAAIKWWNYLGTAPVTGTFNFYYNNAAVNLGQGSAIAYAPDCDRLFVLNKNAGANDGRLYYRPHPDNDTNNENFTQGLDLDGTYATGYYQRMTYFKKNGAEYLMVAGRDATGQYTKVISDLGGTPTELARVTYPWGTNSLADGCDLEWDGGDYIYMVRGGAVQGFRRIRIPDDPSQAGNWNTGTAVWSAELANPAWDGTNGTWGASSSIAVGKYDPPSTTMTVYYQQGSANTGDIPATAPADHWGTVTWTEAENTGDFTVTVQGWDGAGWVALASGVDNSGIDLSAYHVADYAKIRLVGNFTSSPNRLSTPVLYDWTVTTTKTVQLTSRSATCVNCHNVHIVSTGSGSWDVARVSDPANTKNPVSASSPTDNASVNFCLGCHGTTLPTTAANDATHLVPYDPTFRGFVAGAAPYFTGWSKSPTGLEFASSGHFNSTGQKAMCNTCHDPHASDFRHLTAWTMPTGAAGLNAGTRENANASLSREENLCYQCHGNGTIGRQAAGAANVATPANPASGTNNKHVMSSYIDRHEDTESATDLGAANRHSECTDCHDPHVAKKVGGTATQDTVNTSAPGAAVYGALGVTPDYAGALRDSTSNGGTGNWAAPTVYNPLRLSGETNQFEALLCFKCHSGNTTVNAGRTNVAQEFNPSNAGLHNVLGQSIGVQTAFTTVANNGTSYTTTWGWPTSNVFLAGSNMDQNTMLTCTSCHTNESGQAKGPHGSTVDWLIDPNYPTLWTTSYTTTSETDGMFGTPICAKCHDLYNTGWSNNIHSRGTDHGSATRTCDSCHIPIPHGWKRPRLLGYRSDPAPYTTKYLTWIRADTSHTPTNWQESDCGQSGCSQHAATTANPTWQ